MTEEYPQCPRCQDIFGTKEDHISAPKILKCGDTVCKECLLELIKNSEEEYFLCPSCNKQIKKKKNLEKYTTNNVVIKTINNCFNIGKIKSLDKEVAKPIEFNIITLGNFAVGKTSIFQRLSQEKFYEHYLSTIGLDYYIYYLKFRNKKYRLILRDTAGQEKYRSIVQNILKQADGVLFIYDLTNKETFEALKYWYDLYKKENSQVIGLLIGNKSDCEREVDKEEAIKFSDKHGLRYLETSAKTDKNIKKAIAIILQQIIESNENYDSISSIKTSSSINSLQKVNSLSTKLDRRKVKKKSCAC